MNRNIRGIFDLVAWVLIVAAYYASAWMAPAGACTVADGLRATLVILVCCVLLYFLHQHMLSGSGIPTALLYAVLAAAPPAALRYSPFHIAVLLMALCQYCYLHFNAVNPSQETGFIQWASFSSASIVLPPLGWLLPLLLLSSLPKAVGKGRFLATAFLGLVLPLAVWTGIRFCMKDPDPTAFFPEMWAQMATLHLPHFCLPVVTVVRIAMTAAITLAAIIRILCRMSSFRTAEYHACVRLILMTLGLAVIAVLFLSDPATPSGLLLMLPVAPLLSRFVQDNPGRKMGRLLLIILALLLVAERISLFVNP
jgi:hypothetical protein